MIKLISFVVLTHFFQFNQLKILSYFFKLNHQYFFTVYRNFAVVLIVKSEKWTLI